jgi:hypothetical protein
VTKLSNLLFHVKRSSNSTNLSNLFFIFTVLTGISSYLCLLLVARCCELVQAVASAIYDSYDFFFLTLNKSRDDVK